MNKVYMGKLDETSIDELFWKKWKYRIKTRLKKFQKFHKKRKFIKYKYPHRRSNSKPKSADIIKNYTFQDKRWYNAKKCSLLFFNFSKNNYITNVNFDHYLDTNYCDENEFKKIF